MCATPRTPKSRRGTAQAAPILPLVLAVLRFPSGPVHGARTWPGPHSAFWMKDEAGPPVTPCSQQTPGRIGPQRVDRVLLSLPRLPGMGGSSGPSLAALSQQDWTLCPRAPCQHRARITPVSPDLAPPGSALIPRREGRYLQHLRISKEMRRKHSGVPGDGPRPRENVCVLPVKPQGRMGEAAQCWGATESPQVAQSQIYTRPELSPAEGLGVGTRALCRRNLGPPRHPAPRGLRGSARLPG